jgi:hypothetical protein
VHAEEDHVNTSYEGPIFDVPFRLNRSALIYFHCTGRGALSVDTTTNLLQPDLLNISSLLNRLHGSPAAICHFFALNAEVPSLSDLKYHFFVQA